MRTDTHKTIYLKDYSPYPFSIRDLHLNFDIQDGHTIVTQTAKYKKENPAADTLFLNGEGIELHEVLIDDVLIEDYQKTDVAMRLDVSDKEEFELKILTKIYPENNTRLEGLYKSGGTYCTQCEAEGFRRITYYPDRPDVMTTFTVRIEADKKYPILLSNGNKTDEGKLSNNRHFAEWHDPHPKPCYLFALVAGDLTHIHDTFTTMSGRKVDLYIYVKHGDQDQCPHAMDSLKRSMTWDEETYGLEYDLDIFNIVAVSDFNMGAMENKSLNIFNTALVLAQQDTATDSDFMRVESVIAHEYFHNWSGNRVTCRDWFQLSLKEGLTVFRDQEFSADTHSRDVQRIDDVTHLRKFQFPEDSSPLAHPIRPEQYIEINNFYTMTVYEKGAEVIRMMRTILGPENYRKGTDLYFKRHDGQAVTCDDFVKAMEDGSGIDLSQFRLWYSQAGTPEVTFKGSYNPDKKTYEISLTQTTPDTPNQKNKKPMVIPVSVGFLGQDGKEMIETKTLMLSEKTQKFEIENITEEPVPSVLRGFSAPVKLSTDLSDDELAFLMAHDSDGFNRWEAGKTYALRVFYNESGFDKYLESYQKLLDYAQSKDCDHALAARMLSLPEVSLVGQYIFDTSKGKRPIDPQAIHEIRENLIHRIVDKFEDQLVGIYNTTRTDSNFLITAEAMGKRALQNTVFLLMSNRLTDTDAQHCQEHYDSANNMTDRMAALYLACALDGKTHDKILGDFYSRFKDYPLVVDKWFSAQAMIHLPKTLNTIKELRQHKDFNIKNPNRVRSLFSAFAMNNPVRFHDASGAGYEFLRDAVIELNEINPQIGARLLIPLREWRRYTPDRQEKMKAALSEILEIKNIAPDIFEIASKSLNG
ncbi:MAG: aminopeptidase N [Alphaproteobacteria bacterium]|nr:aminopeptidase N [Alphaproteobacteria bacterium]